MKKFSIVFILFVLMMSSVVNAQTNKSINNGKLSEEEQQLLNERSDEIRDYFLKIEKEKAKLDKLKDKKEKMSKEKNKNSLDLLNLDIEIENASNAVAKLTESHEDYGLKKIKKVKKKDSVSILESSAADYRITELQLFYDESVGKYLLHSAGNFTNDDWKEDKSPYTSGYGNGWKDLGGYDGYGLYSMHEDINTYNREFHTIHYEDNSESIDWSNKASNIPDARGYAWKYQDELYLEGGGSVFANWKDYNNYRQLGWYYFSFVDSDMSGKELGFKAIFGHTWSSTTINGISYPNGVSFTTTNNSWDDGYSDSFIIP
ncbi:hypothetical protein [Chengkuizengella marina]|uniref:Uncharacterized protein n=1 Tax=Chengkuizengella marina TaxID=2507566 RepID=A0A6N9Q973_9BACL|nr:hypothetical protein [Chengkuizengella marina]NBI31183.1 hypothetical protein [Chengkuizengella marina]